MSAERSHQPAAALGAPGAAPSAARAGVMERSAIVTTDCPLCTGSGGEVLAQCRDFRVVWPDESGHPGLVRVIWSTHVAEMSDLAAVDRDRLMASVFELESLMRRTLEPDKVNLASLGNMVAHLHWHVIPRWRDDRQFPASIWTVPADVDPTSAKASAALARLAVLRERLPIFHRAVRAAFGMGPGDPPATIG